MSEVAACREYQLDLKAPHQSRKILKEISKLVRSTISPNVCEVIAESHENDPSRIIVSMKCVDGRAVHYADMRSMFKILQLCEESNISHKVGSLEVDLD